MKLTAIILLFFLFISFCKMNNTSNSNLYVLHTQDGDIECNYHNSRDLNNGWLEYYDSKTKEREYIKYWKVDSVTIYNENFWTSGPKDKNLKYIDKRK